MLWEQLLELKARCSYAPQLMVIAENREMVKSYAELFKELASHHREPKVAVYAAFSGKLEHDGRQVDEDTYNSELKALHVEEAHKKADILVVCDRFETGYDNSAVTLLGVDRKIGSDEKLVQIYSRANRRRGGKTFPKVIDFANHVSDRPRL